MSISQATADRLKPVIIGAINDVDRLAAQPDGIDDESLIRMCGNMMWIALWAERIRRSIGEELQRRMEA